VLFAALLTIKVFQPVMVSLFMQGIALASLWASYSYRVGGVEIARIVPFSAGIGTALPGIPGEGSVMVVAS
jgi:hypothetical protein